MKSENNNQPKQSALPTTAAQPAPRRQRLGGITRLYRACEKILRNDGDRIAEALFERAAQGNVSSAKLLIKIIELEARRIRTRKRQAAQRKVERQKHDKKPGRAIC